MVIRINKRRRKKAGSRQRTHFWQLQRRIQETRAAQKAHWKRCHPWIQPPNPPIKCENNSKGSNGPDEYYGTKHNQQKQANHTKRQADPQPKTAIEFWHVRQQEDRKELHQSCQFGFCIQQIINWALEARRLYSDKCILATQIDYKFAYWRGHLHWSTTLQRALNSPMTNWQSSCCVSPLRERHVPTTGGLFQKQSAI